MTGLLIFLAVLLIFVVLFQFARTSELVEIIKDEDNSESRSRLQGRLSMAFLVLGMIAFVWSAIYYHQRFLPISASEHGLLVDETFNTTFILTAIVFFLTQVALFYFAFRYREKKGQKVYFYPDNNKLELIWTIIPAIVMTVLVVQGLDAWYKITSKAPEEKIVFEATGKQYEWIIRYPGMDDELGELASRSEVSPLNAVGINWEDPASRDDFITDKIVLPVNVPVEVKIKALDVLHSFYLPHFRVKMDAVPGTPTSFWFTPIKTTKEMQEYTGDPDFVYELACAELCGRGHSSMRREVEVVSLEDYELWKKGQKPYSELVGAYNTNEDRNLADSAEEIIEEKDNS